METLDNPRPAIDESTVPFFKTSLRYGLIGGLIGIVVGLISNLSGMSTSGSMMGGLVIGAVSIIITILISYFAIRHHRDKELGGYISFGRAFLTGFVALMISTIISTVWSILYMTVIDPGMAEEALAASEEMLANFGLPEEQLEAQLEAMKVNFTPMGIIKNSLLYGAIMVAIITLIQGAIMKKEQPVV